MSTARLVVVAVVMAVVIALAVVISPLLSSQPGTGAAIPPSVAPAAETLPPVAPSVAPETTPTRTTKPTPTVRQYTAEEQVYVDRFHHGRLWLPYSQRMIGSPEKSSGTGNVARPGGSGGGEPRPWAVLWGSPTYGSGDVSVLATSKRDAKRQAASLIPFDAVIVDVFRI